MERPADLHRLRQEIVGNLQGTVRPADLTQELLDEVRSIDRALADQALFLLDETFYAAPGGESDSEAVDATQPRQDEALCKEKGEK